MQRDIKGVTPPIFDEELENAEVGLPKVLNVARPDSKVAFAVGILGARSADGVCKLVVHVALLLGRNDTTGKSLKSDGKQAILHASNDPFQH